MFAIVCLLNVNYTILRSARNALAVADLGGGAAAIPWFELCGTMPGAFLMTLGLTYLLNRYSLRRVFFIVLCIFVAFFLIFAMGVYPWLSSFSQGSYIPILASMIFFVMAELWKIALLTVLFWGLMNQYVPLDQAKKYYAPLMLGGSIGTILAGPLISLCTSSWIIDSSWAQSLVFLMWMLLVVSLCTAWAFQLLWKQCIQFSRTSPVQEEAPPKQTFFVWSNILIYWKSPYLLWKQCTRLFLASPTQEEVPPKQTLSLWSSILICWRSPYLLLLAWVTIADYIAYALGEVVFLDVLRQKFPDPREYCDFMGTLSVCNGVLTAFSALVITPYLLKRCRWVVASLVTPICLLITEGFFFFAVWHPAFSHELEFLVILGSLFFCVVRAAKYTLFDTSKEISFLLLPPLEKMQGKLVVDGMCARLGRGGGACITLGLIQIFGSVLAIVPLAGGLAVLIAGSCAWATSRLGALVEKTHATAEKAS